MRERFEPMDLVGQLLIATPVISDDTFERTVILLLAHGEGGALGVVLNRPSETRATDVLPGWGALAASPAVVFIGGPVELNGVIGLGPHGSVDLNVEASELDVVPDRVRLFAGSAGWGPGQLEGEIAEGAWWVVDAQPGDPFDRDPASLWSRVLRRQSDRTAWFASYPRNPVDN